jgi:acetylornithine deacetylase/succinyl-diaminopimelate desuccinylase-like protein
VVVAGIGLPDDGMHSANEKLGVEQFLNGIRVYARFLTTMATYDRGDVR